MKGPCCRREKRVFGFLAWGNDASVLNVNRTGGDDGQKLGTHACCRVLITRLRASIECIYDTTFPTHVHQIDAVSLRQRPILVHVTQAQGQRRHESSLSCSSDCQPRGYKKD